MTRYLPDLPARAIEGPGDSSAGSAPEDVRDLPERRDEMEGLIRSISGVTGCRVVFEPSGEISEVHVLASGERPAKMLVRDVQSLLLVHLDVSLPYQKVSVVTTGQRPKKSGPRSPTPPLGSPAGATAEFIGTGRGLESLAQPAPPVTVGAGKSPGPALESVAIRPLGRQVEVIAQVRMPDRRVLTGRYIGLLADSTAASAGAQAVLMALVPGRPGVALRVEDVHVVGSPGATAVVVLASAASESGEGASGLHHAVGACLVGGNVTVAAAAAAVEALGKLLPAVSGTL